MRTSEIDMLIIPGLTNSGPDHWQSRWERHFRTARRVEQDDWESPRKDAWVGRIIEAVAFTSRPCVLVAHSLGSIAVAHAARKLPRGAVTGAFLVAAPDLEAPGMRPARNGGFAPVPLAALPFPAMLVASNNDPYCPIEQARAFAEAWGATLVEAGRAGHINTESRHGPWPEGLLRFGTFLKGLAPAVH